MELSQYLTSSDKEWSKIVQMFNGSDIEWHSKTENPNHSKSYQIATILNSLLVQFLNGQDYSCSYVPDHSNTKPSQIWTSKRLDFEWVLVLKVRHSSGSTKGHQLGPVWEWSVLYQIMVWTNVSLDRPFEYKKSKCRVMERFWQIFSIRSFVFPLKPFAPNKSK